MVRPTNPELWERVKRKWRRKDLGTPSGDWGLRKLIMARLEYHRRGGEWRVR